jgi:hypothetical protein
MINKKEATKVLLRSTVLIFILLVVSWFSIAKYQSLKKQKEARVFISQIVDSVFRNTNFYQHRTDSNVIEKLETHRDLMSNQYTISTIDYSWGIYEAKIVFDNGVSVKVDVIFQYNMPFLYHFHILNDPVTSSKTPSPVIQEDK